MNGIETIIQRLNTDAKAETDALLDKARQDAAAVTARCQAQADKETADLAARNQRAAAEREERLVSAAQMEARKTILAAKQAVMEEVYAKALEKLRGLPQDRAVEVLASLLNEAAPQGKGEVLFSAQDRETVGRAAVDAANAQNGGQLTLSDVFPDRREVPVARILHARDQWLLRQSKIALPDLLLDQRNVCPQALPHKHGCHELLRHLKDRIAVQFQDLPRIPLHDQTDIKLPVEIVDRILFARLCLADHKDRVFVFHIIYPFLFPI